MVRQGWLRRFFGEGYGWPLVLAFAIALCTPYWALGSVSVTVNGVSYTIPQTNERNWGTNVTSWIQAISSNTLQPTGGTFTLGADIDFGASFGLKSTYYKTRTANPSTSGNFRLANTDTLCWRNSANGANLCLNPNVATDGVLQYNSVDIPTISSTHALTNKTISFASNTFSSQLGVANGGTGASTLTLNNVLLGNGTSAPQFVAPSSSGNVLTSNGTTWQSTAPASSPQTPYEITNVACKAAVAASALTISIKQGDGTTDCAAGTGACKIGFRSTTTTSGAWSQVSQVSAVTDLVISSGSTLGHADATDSYIYVYALNNAGTVVPMASSQFIDDGEIQTTTAEGGAGAADVWTTPYTTSTQTSKAVRLICAMKSNQTTAGTWAAAPTVYPVPFRIPKKFWRVDSDLAGANISLGTSNQATYTVGIENASLVLTNNSCSSTNTQCLTAWVPCSTTVATTGTTCASGSESMGVSWVLPEPGDVMACVSFSHELDVGGSAAAGSLDTTFQIVATGNADQTVSAEGRTRLDSYLEMVAAGGNREIVAHPYRLCGTFTFSTTGRKTLRVFYEQLVSGTITASTVYADGNTSRGQRDIHWEVWPLNSGIYQ